MKDKIADGIFKMVMILLSAIVVIGGIAIVIAWHLGIPYFFYWVFDKELSYSTVLAMWFGIYFVRNVFKVMSLKKKLKQYEEIDNIMKGRF